MNSKRNYVVVVVVLEENSKPACQEINLQEITHPKENDWEYIYALHDILDEVLDLNVLDVLPFQANRDNPKQKGVIIRKT